MRNDIGPDYVEMLYTGNGHTHKMTVSYILSGSVSPGNEPNAVTNALASVPVGTLVNAYADVLKAMLKTTDSFSSYTVYHKDSPTSQPEWIYADSIDSATGTSTDAISTGAQISISFRTRYGGRFRVQLMEVPCALNFVFEGTSFEANAPFAALRDYLVGDNGWVIGRDGGRIMVVIRAVTKTNDALRRRFVL